MGRPNVTVESIRADVVNRIRWLEQEHGFTEGKVHTSVGTPDQLYTFEAHQDFGRYLALRDLLWRIDNPEWLGKS